MKKNLLIAVLMTLATTVLFGLVYPLVVTGLAQLFMKDKANGQLIVQNGTVIASRIIGQPFVGPGYFHSRPSAAGTGYDADGLWRIQSWAHESCVDGPRGGFGDGGKSGEPDGAGSRRSGHDLRVWARSRYHSRGG